MEKILQIIFFIVMLLIAISGANLILILVYAFKFGKWQGILEEKIKGIEERLNNHIPSQFDDLFLELKNFTTRIDNMEEAMDKRIDRIVERLTIIETKIKIETEE